MGEDALGQDDLTLLEFLEKFEKTFVNQGRKRIKHNCSGDDV